MAADNEARLIGKIIRDRDIVPALQRGIQEDWFLDEDNRKVWKFIRKHYTDYSEVPTAVTVKDHYPNYKILSVDDTIDYLLDTMVTFRRWLLTRDGATEVVAHLEKKDHEQALLQMERTIAKVNEQGVLGTHEVDITKTIEERHKEYLELQTHTLKGIRTGYEKIDEATAGLQGGQLVTIIAPPKTGKSMIALQTAINIHEQGLKPMFQSFEMSNKEQEQRHDAMRAHVSHSRLRRGTLVDTEYRRYISMLNDLEQKPQFTMVDAVNGLTVGALTAKLAQTSPDVVFVDGVYLMIDEQTGEQNTPQAITNVTRALKRLAQKRDIPIVITTQTLLWKMRGGKVTADSIGYSSSFFQDSDVILGLEPVEEDENIRLLKIVASRNCAPSETSLTWRWDTGCFHEESKSGTCKFCQSWEAL
jgi:replicative DNA helicase